MLELYHNDMSVCAAKVRTVLAEKRLEWKGVHMDLRAGDTQKPEYLKLNPNAVVPTIVHDGRVLIESVNMAKRHTKPNPQAGKQGGIIEKEMPLPVSKVAIWNPGAKKGDRVGIKTLTDGKRVRFFKSNGEMLDV